jgi:hypothetical protein
LAYKGIRVGEAKNPGPSTLEVISLKCARGTWRVKRAIEGLLQDEKRTKPGILALKKQLAQTAKSKP